MIDGDLDLTAARGHRLSRLLDDVRVRGPGNVEERLQDDLRVPPLDFVQRST